ncbi:aminoacyl-tRNA hydrolase [candidate division WOR-3 bacterium]|nr:aminoacyl-tRNA hydrolase [candidate division WOR-3 bacterium]
MRLHVFGLGNPGKKYEMTRHNAGMIVLDGLARNCGGKWIKRKDYDSFLTKIDGTELELVKPKRFMNNSGDVLAIMGLTDEEIGESLFVADDFELKLGALRFRRAGSSGGHKGFSSVESYTGKKFQRLKIGIGPLPEGEDPAEFVLSSFEASQEDQLSEVLEKSFEAIIDWALKGIDYAMNKYNRQYCSKEEDRR